MTNRRKFIAGLGALATGSAAAMGTGAFTSVQAERTVSVNLVGDADAYLKLIGNTDYVSNDNKYGQLTIDLGAQSNSQGAQGFNKNAATVLEGVFTIANQGEDAVKITLGPDSMTAGEVDNADLTWNQGVYFEVDEGDSGGENNIGDSGGHIISPGETTTVDVAVVVKDNAINTPGDLTINADEY